MFFTLWGMWIAGMMVGYSLGGCNNEGVPPKLSDNEAQVASSAMAIARKAGLTEVETPCTVLDAAITLARMGMDVVPAAGIDRPHWAPADTLADYWICTLRFATGDTTTRIYIPDAIGIYKLKTRGVRALTDGTYGQGPYGIWGWSDNGDGSGAIWGVK